MHYDATKSVRLQSWNTFSADRFGVDRISTNFKSFEKNTNSLNRIFWTVNVSILKYEQWTCFLRKLQTKNIAWSLRNCKYSVSCGVFWTCYFLFSIFSRSCMKISILPTYFVKLFYSKKKIISYLQTNSITVACDCEKSSVEKNVKSLSVIKTKKKNQIEW